MKEYFCSVVGDKVLYYHDVIETYTLSNTNHEIEGLLHCSNTMCNSDECPLISECPEQINSI